MLVGLGSLVKSQPHHHYPAGRRVSVVSHSLFSVLQNRIADLLQLPVSSLLKVVSFPISRPGNSYYCLAASPNTTLMRCLLWDLWLLATFVNMSRNPRNICALLRKSPGPPGSRACQPLSRPWSNVLASRATTPSYL